MLLGLKALPTTTTSDWVTRYTILISEYNATSISLPVLYYTQFLLIGKPVQIGTGYFSGTSEQRSTRVSDFIQIHCVEVGNCTFFLTTALAIPSTLALSAPTPASPSPPSTPTTTPAMITVLNYTREPGGELTMHCLMQNRVHVDIVFDSGMPGATAATSTVSTGTARTRPPLPRA
jgi:hypothetical protein